MDIINKKILVTGSAGFLGKHVLAELDRHGIKNISSAPRVQFDLREMGACERAIDGCQIVIHLAGNVGGIGYNQKNPGALFYDNIMMGVQLIEASRHAGVEKVVIVGTICAYPKFTPVPFKEEDLWTGYPEETNAPYGLAKKALLVQLQAYRQQYGMNGIYLLPVNLYGPGDNFDPESSHVIPALIRRFAEAKSNGSRSVEIWGSGNATREFLFVKDAARAIVLATQYYDSSNPVNIGSGMEVTICALAEKIADIIGYNGELIWDASKPDGQPKRMLDTTKAWQEFKFRANTDFDSGLRQTIKWYLKK